MASTPFAARARRVAPFLTGKHGLGKVIRGAKPSAKQRNIVNSIHRLLFGAKQASGGYAPGLVNGEVYPFTFNRATKRGEKAYQALRAATGQADSKHLSTVFVPTIAGKRGTPLKPRLRVAKDGAISWSVGGTRMSFESFNRRKLATDPDTEIERVLALFPKAQAFHIKCGRALSKHQFARKSVKAKVKQWQGQYDNWRKWLNGVEPLEFLNQAGREAYLAWRTEYLGRQGKGKKKAKKQGKRRGR